MRWMLLVVLLSGCDGVGFEAEESPQTPADCMKQGGKVAVHSNGVTYCEMTTREYAAQVSAHAVASDGGTSD
jgi:hypothetical protein